MTDPTTRAALAAFFLLALSAPAKTAAQPGTSQPAVGLVAFTDLFDSEKGADIACYRIPAVLTAQDGSLVVAIDERVPSCRDLKWSDDINIVIRRSADGGATWSAIETVADYPLGESASDPSMILDRSTGELFLFYNYMNRAAARDVYRLHVMRSADNGRTWTAPVDITSRITKPEWSRDFMFITSGRGIQTRKGMLLHTLVNLNSGMHLFGSADHGSTWFVIEGAIQPADESKIVELANGDWLVNSRVNGLGMRFSHRSRDLGKTWRSEPLPGLPDPGCNGSIIRYTAAADGYTKNRLLFSNANSPSSRENLTVRISYDEGRSWSVGKTVYAGSAAYSSLTVLNNGDIGLVFERDGYAKTAFAKFTLDWLTDGRDRIERPR